MHKITMKFSGIVFLYEILIYAILSHLHGSNFNKKHAYMKLLRFSVFRTSFIRKNVEFSQTERVKKCYQQLDFGKKIKEVEALFWTFGISSIVILLLG